MTYRQKYIKYKTKYNELKQENNDVHDEDTFINFLNELASEDKSNWENKTLDTFLYALGAAYQDHKESKSKLYTKLKKTNNPWTIIAEMFEVAKIYE